MPLTMDTPLDRVLGRKTADVMQIELGLRTVRDLLRHYPRRYATRGEMTKLSDLQVGDRVTVLAQVLKVTTRPMKQRRGTITEVSLAGDTAAVDDGAPGSVQLFAVDGEELADMAEPEEGDNCRAFYDAARGDGYAGLCPSCADDEYDADEIETA